jgi:hypothetical protein
VAGDELVIVARTQFGLAEITRHGRAVHEDRDAATDRGSNNTNLGPFGSRRGDETSSPRPTWLSPTSLCGNEPGQD